MSKIVRARTSFLRFLWLFFVLAMAAGLVVCITLLIFDFLLYDVSVQTRVLSKRASAFPAITLCHHHPFSRRAFELWANKTVESPRDFNRGLRQFAYKRLQEEDINQAESAFFYDSMSVYYQNVDFRYVYELGHDFGVFLYCVRLHGAMMTFENDCRKLAGYDVKRLSHNQYFNCYTFEPKTQLDSDSTDFLGLIVSLGPQPDYTNFEQGLFMDLFESAKGLRVVVHEPGSLPDFDLSGIHVEPGKLNEINYQPVHWTRSNTPKRPCSSNTSGIRIIDLHNQFAYTYEQCLKQQMQLRLMDQCKCILSLYPRVQLPSDQLPYCAGFRPSFNAFIRRLDCLGKIDYTDSSSSSSQCPQPCDYFEYETTVSITRWDVKNWQLHWLLQQNNALRHLKTLKASNRTVHGDPMFAVLEDYFLKENLSQVNSSRDRMLEGDNFAYVVLKRKTSSVVRKIERLVLSLNVLLSRIGGLCSLSIGLTAAFAVEVIEFVYVLYLDRKELRKSSSATNSTSTSAFNGKQDELIELDDTPHWTR